MLMTPTIASITNLMGAGHDGNPPDRVLSIRREEAARARPRDGPGSEGVHRRSRRG
jgi:hypothetical protein